MSRLCSNNRLMDRPVRAARTVVMMLGVWAPLGACASAGGQGPVPLPAPRAAFTDPTNAALVYYQAWTSTPKDLADRLNKEYSRELAWRPSEELVEQMEATPHAVTELLRASAIEGADWGVAWSQGVMALLPHVGLARTSSRLLSADARRLVDAGRADEAAERAAAMFRLARHMTSEPVFISGLVAAAIDADADAAARVVIGAPGLTGAARQRLVIAARSLDERDPFAMRAALDAERRWVIAGLPSAIVKNGKVDPDMVAKIVGFISPPKDAVAQVNGLTAEALTQDLKKMDGFFDAALRAWDEPDAVERLRALEARGKSGEFGAAAVLFMPVVSTVRAAHDKSMARREQLIKDLSAAPASGAAKSGERAP